MKHTNFLTSSIMFIYYFIFVTVSFFLARELTTQGISLSTMGFLAVIGLVLLIVSLLLNGYLTDKLITNKRLLIIYMTITLISFIGFIIATNLIVLSLFYLMIWFFFMPLTSIIDGLALSLVGTKKYSLIRSVGSIGAAISFFLNSWILDGLGFDTIFIFNIFLIIIMIIMLSFLANPPVKEKIDYVNALKVVAKNKNIILIMLITFATYGTLNADDAYQITYAIEYTKLSPTVVGIVGFLSIILEAAIMILFTRIYQEKRVKMILNICITTLLLIFLSKALFYENKEIVILGNIMIGIFVGLFIPVSIRIISTNVDKNILNSILSLFQMFIKLGGATIGLITSLYLASGAQLPSIYFLHAVVLLFAYVFVYMLNTNNE